MENAGTPPSQSQVQSQSHRTPSTEWTHVATNPVPQPDSAVMTPNGDSSDPKSPPTKRRRADRERTRVSRACDRCKRKKTRCTGRCPCALCLRSGLPCEFTASYTRGRLPSVIVDEAALAASSQPRIPMPGQVSTPGSSPKDSTTPTFQFQGPLPTPTLDRSSAIDILTRSDQLNEPDIKEAPREIVSRNSPEPTQTDQQGHYVGSSSAVSFLLRIQKRLHQNSSLSHDSTIFTFGDAPLPEFDPTFFVLPPKGDAQRLVERYFDFAAPTHRFLHRASMEKLLHEFYDTQGDMRSKEDAAAKTALLFIVFAQGQAYMPPGSTTHENRSSARYFFASEHQLSKERGAVRLASVQARLGQCFYLLSQSRINHCWSLFGTTAHLALAIGLHRGRRCNPSAGVDYVELECRKRCFWSMYTLDKYLAAALGRPRTFKDEDIDQELPIVVNDNDLQPLSINPPSKISHYSEMMAPVEHIKLSRIISLVLRDLYPIRPPSLPLRAELAAKYTCDLHAWRSSLSRFLDSSTIDTSLLIPLYQRQRSVLNLGYYHAMLLIHRPFLLSNFASLTWIDPTRPGPAGHGNSHTSSTDTSFPPNNHHHHPLNANVDTSQNTTQCLEAAMNIVRVVDEIFNSSQIFRVFWFTQYYAFCAVVVLYIYRIQQHLVTPGKCEGYFAAGQKCQKQLETVSETDCLARRYCLVLEELRLEAVRQSHAVGGAGASSTNNSTTATTAAGFSTNNTTDSLQNPSTNLSVPGSTPQSDTSPNSGIPGSFYTSTGTGTIPPTPESTAFNTSYLPSSSVMADLTSWGQFDSLVTAGIGMLDGSLSLQGDAAGFGFGFGL